jgi:hypothetical protein
MLLQEVIKKNGKTRISRLIVYTYDRSSYRLQLKAARRVLFALNADDVVTVIEL